MSEDKLFTETHNYDSDAIQTLEWHEHIRRRAGMYIGRLGSGSEPDDGIYILLKEATDNSIDEHLMGFGKKIVVDVHEGCVKIRDFGRGIPLDKIHDCAGKMNTGGKYDSKAFQRSVGLNGVGIKAVNALSSKMRIEAYRDGKTRTVEFSRGICTHEDKRDRKTEEENGTFIEFIPDETIFNKYVYRHEYIEQLLYNYAYLNTGLTLVFNGKSIRSKRGLLDLLEDKLDGDPRYIPFHVKNDDAEISLTLSTSSGTDLYSFVNGQYTRDGGTHEQAFRECYIKAIRDHFKKQSDTRDIVSSLTACIAVRIQEPVFESQTKTKLGSETTGPNEPSLRVFMQEFFVKAFDNFLHKNPESAKIIEENIEHARKDREELQGVKKIAKKRERSAKIVNKKLRDCKYHLNEKNRRGEESMIFITEGDSASGSITTARDTETQAVFSLRGKPLNSFGLKKRVVYENEEFYLLQNALGIEDGLEKLRYNKVIIASDADSDGYHIRLLCCTYFLQFFPELVRRGHLYFLETPLFRVRSKKKTRYCYSEEEKDDALEELGKNAEITRFKGLGEVSPAEFEQFIGDEIRLEPVLLNKATKIQEILRYYMGDNTPERRENIVNGLRIERDLLNEKTEEEEA